MEEIVSVPEGDESALPCESAGGVNRHLSRTSAERMEPVHYSYQNSMYVAVLPLQLYL
jgi:hypothetical protein